MSSLKGVRKEGDSNHSTCDSRDSHTGEQRDESDTSIAFKDWLLKSW